MFENTDTDSSDYQLREVVDLEFLDWMLISNAKVSYYQGVEKLLIQLDNTLPSSSEIDFLLTLFYLGHDQAQPGAYHYQQFLLNNSDTTLAKRSEAFLPFFENLKTTPEKAIDYSSAPDNEFLNELYSRINARHKAFKILQEAYNAPKDISLDTLIKWMNEAYGQSSYGLDVFLQSTISNDLINLNLNLEQYNITFQHTMDFIVSNKKMNNEEVYLNAILTLERLLSIVEPVDSFLPAITTLIPLFYSEWIADTIATQRDPKYFINKAQKKVGVVIELESGVINDLHQALLLNPKDGEALGLLNVVFLHEYVVNKDLEALVLRFYTLKTLSILNPTSVKVLESYNITKSIITGDYDHKPSTKNEEALAYFKKAEKHFANRELDEAIADYKAAIQLDSTLQKAYLYLGDCYFARKEYMEAIPYFEKAVRMHTRDEQARRFLMDAYNRVDLDSLDPIVLNNSQFMDGPRSRKKYQAFINSQKSNPYQMLNLGEWYLQREIMNPAFYHYSMGLMQHLDEPDVVIYALRKILYIRKNKISVRKSRYRDLVLYALDDKLFLANLTANVDSALQKYQFKLEEDNLTLLKKTDFNILPKLFNGIKHPSSQTYGNEFSLALYLKIDTLLKKDEVDEALKVLSEITSDVNTIPAKTFFLMGTLLFEYGYYDVAYLYFLESKFRGHTSSDLNLFLGHCELLIGFPTAALNFYKQVGGYPKSFLGTGRTF